jgi:hypothetical protein
VGQDVAHFQFLPEGARPVRLDLFAGRANDLTANPECIKLKSFGRQWASAGD